MRLFPVCLAAALWPALASAVPMQLTHTGRLFDDAGLPLTGTHTLTVALYDDTATTTATWSEALSADFDNGFFAIELGADTNNPLDDVVFDGNALFVGLAIDSDPELPQRQRVVSVPYAYRANTTTHLNGGVVDASAIYVNGNQVFDATGVVIGSPTLGNMSCGPDEVPLYNGNTWGCTARRPNWTDLVSVPPDLLDGDDDTDTLGSMTCADQDIPRWSQTNAAWECSTDRVLTESDVETYITNAALDLAPGTTVDGAFIATGVHYSDPDVLAVIGTEADANPMNHSRYADTEALAAMGANDDSNALNHDRYTDAEAISAAQTIVGTHYTDADALNAMGTLDDANPLNHDRYTDFQAVAAMGGKGVFNPLNHDAYTDADAQAAVGAHFTSFDAISAMGPAGNNNTLNHARYTDGEAMAAVGAHFTSGDAVAAMGVLQNSNSLNHTRYGDSEATAAMGSKADANPLHHDRYTDNDAISAAQGAIGPHFTASDAVTAMGTKLNTNPLHHDRYTNTEATGAMGAKGNSNPLHHDRYTTIDAVNAMGSQSDSNPLRHARYTDGEAVAAVAADDAYVKNTGDTITGALDFGSGASDDLTASDVTTLTSGGNADALHSHTDNVNDADANASNELITTFDLVNTDDLRIIEAGTTRTVDLSGLDRRKVTYQINDNAAYTEQLGGRYHMSIRRPTYDGRTKAVPQAIIEAYCGDIEGCKVTLGMTHWGSIEAETASRGPYNFTYDISSRRWRMSNNDASGIDGASGTQHALSAWDTCYFTDGTYSGYTGLGDGGVGMNLLLWNGYGGANRTCELTIED